jgi:hypothetical protein
MLAKLVKFAELYLILDVSTDVFFFSKSPNTGETAGTSALPGRNFRPIRRYLKPDLAVRSANGWRCSNISLVKHFLSRIQQNRAIYFKLNENLLFLC